MNGFSLSHGNNQLAGSMSTKNMKNSTLNFSSGATTSKALSKQMSAATMKKSMKIPTQKKLSVNVDHSSHKKI